MAARRHLSNKRIRGALDPSPHPSPDTLDTPSRLGSFSTRPFAAVTPRRARRREGSFRLDTFSKPYFSTVTPRRSRLGGSSRLGSFDAVLLDGHSSTDLALDWFLLEASLLEASLLNLNLNSNSVTSIPFSNLSTSMFVGAVASECAPNVRGRINSKILCEQRAIATLARLMSPRNLVILVRQRSDAMVGVVVQDS